MLVQITLSEVRLGASTFPDGASQHRTTECRRLNVERLSVERLNVERLNVERPPRPSRPLGQQT